MTDPHNMDRLPRRLMDSLPTHGLDHLVEIASLSSEVARADREELDRQVQARNGEIRDAIGEVVDVQAVEQFIKLNDGEWRYTRISNAPSPTSRVYARGLLEGLQVMD